jgi:hypothetical protein
MFEKRWFVDECHALMTLWDLLSGTASPETATSYRKH